MLLFAVKVYFLAHNTRFPLFLLQILIHLYSDTNCYLNRIDATYAIQNYTNNWSDRGTCEKTTHTCDCNAGYMGKVVSGLGIYFQLVMVSAGMVVIVFGFVLFFKKKQKQKQNKNKNEKQRRIGKHPDTWDPCCLPGVAYGYIGLQYSF